MHIFSLFKKLFKVSLHHLWDFNLHINYFFYKYFHHFRNVILKFTIDLIERLPTPWGLVRSGVAPDHPKIKSVSKVFEKVATAGNLSLFGNIEVGSDISLEELKDKYDAVILATGSSVGKKLGLPGEELSNSISAADFVPWYNGHPDYEDFKINLTGKTAIVIGAGNVAMDCARMLALDPRELDTTDTADRALVALHKSSIRKVYISGRRGPEHAAFTAPELRELAHLEHTDVYFNEEDREKIDELLNKYIAKSLVHDKDFFEFLIFKVKPYLNLSDEK